MGLHLLSYKWCRLSWIITTRMAILAQTILATQLAIACSLPTLHYLAGSRSYPPIFPMICLSYGYQFAIPVFTRYPMMETLEGNVFLSDDDVTAALWLAIFGATTFITGYFLIARRSIRTRFPALNLHLNKNKAFVHCIIVVAVYPFISTIQELGGQNSSIFNHCKSAYQSTPSCDRHYELARIFS